MSVHKLIFALVLGCGGFSRSSDPIWSKVSCCGVTYSAQTLYRNLTQGKLARRRHNAKAEAATYLGSGLGIPVSLTLCLWFGATVPTAT